MRVLLDTCAVVKWADGTMPASAQEVLLNAERRHVSVLSSWEIQLKPELGSRISQADFQTIVKTMHLEVVPLHLDHVRALAGIHELPILPHKDPFDHMLIAQAFSLSVPILTCDQRFKSYPGLQVLW